MKKEEEEEEEDEEEEGREREEEGGGRGEYVMSFSVKLRDSRSVRLEILSDTKPMRFEFRSMSLSFVSLRRMIGGT